MRILIAGSKASQRSALNLYLQNRPGMDVVAEATDAETLLALAQATQPDVVVLDWALCDRHPEDLVSAVHQIDSQPEIIVNNARPGSKPEAVAAGVSAFVALGDYPISLLLAIETVRIQRED